jgi:hypothetical protein
MKVWASSDLASAQQTISKMAESVAKRAAISGVIEGLSETDPKQAFELAQKSDTFPNVTDKLFENWVEKDPQEAASHLAQLSPKFDRRSAIYTIATKWADTDLPNALQWAETLPENDAKVNGSTAYRTPMSFVVANWMDRDSAAALRWIEERPVECVIARHGPRPIPNKRWLGLSPCPICLPLERKVLANWPRSSEPIAPMRQSMPSIRGSSGTATPWSAGSTNSPTINGSRD